MTYDEKFCKKILFADKAGVGQGIYIPFSLVWHLGQFWPAVAQTTSTQKFHVPQNRTAPAMKYEVWPGSKYVWSGLMAGRRSYFNAD